MARTPRIVIRKSRRKAVRITVAGFLLGIAGGLFLEYAGNALVGWCFLIAALFTLLLGIGSLADRRPYLVLTERGITEPFSIREEIAWEAILGVDDFFFRGQYIVRLLLDRRYKPDLIRPGWFWRFDRIYANEGVKAVYIRTSGLEIGSKRLTDLIRRMQLSDITERRERLQQGLQGIVADSDLQRPKR